MVISYQKMLKIFSIVFFKSATSPLIAQIIFEWVNTAPIGPNSIWEQSNSQNLVISFYYQNWFLSTTVLVFQIFSYKQINILPNWKCVPRSLAFLFKCFKGYYPKYEIPCINKYAIFITYHVSKSKNHPQD